MPDRVPFQADVRAAAMTLVSDYAADVDLVIQVYRGRPASIHPPTAFVDTMRETYSPFAAPSTRERIAQCDLVCLWGLFDSGDAVDQRDRFVDGFADWVIDRWHAAGANTLIEVAAVADDPSYRPDWVKPEAQRNYFATTITLEGRAST